jgi:hypothetical protein
MMMMMQRKESIVILTAKTSVCGWVCAYEREREGGDIYEGVDGRIVKGIKDNRRIQEESEGMK